MSGHLPSLDRDALRRLRQFVAAMARDERATVPMRELVELAGASRDTLGDPQAGITIDFEATQELQEPMIVIRIPSASSATPDWFERLTPREREVATCLSHGLLNKQIAFRFGLTLATVKDHVHRVLQKSGLPNRAAVAAALAGPR